MIHEPQYSQQHYLQLPNMEATSVSIKTWIDKEDVTHTHTHTLEYYSAKKKNKILLYPTTWMDLEGIMLNEINQTKKDKYSITLLICEI